MTVSNKTQFGICRDCKSRVSKILLVFERGRRGEEALGALLSYRFLKVEPIV